MRNLMIGVTIGVLISLCILFLLAPLGLLSQTPLGYLFFWTGSKILQSQSAGNEVISRLEQYRKEVGRYPPYLDDLPPKMRRKMPHPVAGNKVWIYHASEDGQRFSLGFALDERGYPKSWFDSTDEKWHEDQ